MNIHVPARARLRPSELVAEYEEKRAALKDAAEAFNRAGTALEMAITIGGTYGGVSVDDAPPQWSLEKSLLTSAWKHLYESLSIARLASPSEKRRFEQSMADPAPFTIDNIKATFGPYVQDPRGAVLRGLAEVFCELDHSYKSHDKVRIGVKGLPKRVIIESLQSYGGWGRDKLESVLNALASYQGLALASYPEIDRLMEEGSLTEAWTYKRSRKEGDEVEYPARGVWLKRFKNGNGHLFFDEQALLDINRALAEFYGDVLPDCHEARPEKRRASTAVSKDLQYYATPMAVVERVLDEAGIRPPTRILEPSCGCGRFMDALRAKGATVIGYEVDPGRAEQCRRKGHSVITGNFLEAAPTGDFDQVVMNPPFYGKHYAKHVDHAMKFLKPGGRLTAILPATARYDHGLVDGRWYDLPLGSFSESGTNINTCVLTKWREAA